MMMDLVKILVKNATSATITWLSTIYALMMFAAIFDIRSAVGGDNINNGITNSCSVVGSNNTSISDGMDYIRSDAFTDFKYQFAIMAFIIGVVLSLDEYRKFLDQTRCTSHLDLSHRPNVGFDLGNSI